MYRTRWQPDQFIALRLPAARALSLAALAGYPMGALVTVLVPDGSPAQSAGRLLAMAAAFCALVVVASRTHRLLTVKPAELDEYQLSLRHRATATAYTIFTVLVLTGLFYVSLAIDLGWWLPSDEDHWNGIFWGTILYAALLPTAVLVWTNSADPAGEDAGEEASS